ncbi:uncharacterized protein LOC119690202 [Teleopsis dalmanni]|uniref:uncharacterized protein LOC119690202 n=1 Tax=Teleopsis dalmanni TaxID=139649 RepID=UPI0018CEEBF5|nr:uncharacterized protein LOC119690202 [Teleopsis dalmanni]
MEDRTGENKPTAVEQQQPQQQNDTLNYKGRPISLRRQPTKYPHGFGISIQTTTGNDREEMKNSMPSELLNWTHSNAHQEVEKTLDNVQQQKYKISVISNCEDVPDLQVRRCKYSLTGNYCLNDLEHSTKSAMLLREYTQRFWNWKFLRWPVMIIVSALLFFGVIAYCVWLHDISVVRQRRYQFNQLQILQKQKSSDSEIDFTQLPTTTKVVTTTKSTDIDREVHEMTILRAVSTNSHQNYEDQKLSTKKNRFSYIESEKNNKKFVNLDGTILTTEESTLIPANIIRFRLKNEKGYNVPKEDKPTIFRFLNTIYSQNPQETTTSNFAKVSPTIPPITPSMPTSAMAAMRTTVQENGCYSTSLQMCRGVLDYDLTYNVSAAVTAAEADAYQRLIYSNCSLRAVEFICAALEPECRPKHIGILMPCRRFCKGILEACSEIIANSDTLTDTFDCNRYPDSSDAHKCEDSTRRRGFCYDNEFQCLDRTCIPQQWECDNIKDCSSGEDENNCLICDRQDEFRCRSNEKCVSESVRCDLKYDCFDGSDEEYCEDIGSGDEPLFNDTSSDLFSQIFSYASFLPPNDTNNNLYTYITATTKKDSEGDNKFDTSNIHNRSSSVADEINNNVPSEDGKVFVNFRDSKEIMMTSDSENKLKYSAARTNRTSSKTSTNTTPLQPAASVQIAVTTDAPKIPVATCSDQQLRCVSGKCITVQQICDKIMDCPDGADELMCVYKERRTTTTRYTISEPTTTTRSSKRTMRTTTTKKRVTT